MLYSRVEKQERAYLLLYLWSASETGNGISTEIEIPLSLANVERRHEISRFDSYRAYLNTRVTETVNTRNRT